MHAKLAALSVSTESRLRARARELADRLEESYLEAMRCDLADATLQPDAIEAWEPAQSSVMRGVLGRARAELERACLIARIVFP